MMQSDKLKTVFQLLLTKDVVWCVLTVMWQLFPYFTIIWSCSFWKLSTSSSGYMIQWVFIWGTLIFIVPHLYSVSKSLWVLCISESSFAVVRGSLIYNMYSLCRFFIQWIVHFFVCMWGQSKILCPETFFLYIASTLYWSKVYCSSHSEKSWGFCKKWTLKKTSKYTVLTRFQKRGWNFVYPNHWIFSKVVESKMKRCYFVCI